jgi:alpha-L-fucosidase
MHVLPRPDGAAPLRSIVVPEFPAGPKLLRARVLGAAADLPLKRARPTGSTVELPEPTPVSPTVIVELTYDGSVMELSPRTL